MKSRSFGFFALFVVVGFMMFSCDSTVLYDAQVDLPEGDWYKDEAVKFDIEISDTLLPYDFNLSINHTTDYRYSNLYLFMVTRFPDGKLSRDTIEIMLAYPNGEWLGKGWGASRDMEIPLRSQLFFPQAGVYQFYLQQAMRTDTLKEVLRVGLQLKLSGEQYLQD